jgi:hypothetical protein
MSLESGADPVAVENPSTEAEEAAVAPAVRKIRRIGCLDQVLYVATWGALMVGALVSSIVMRYLNTHPIDFFAATRWSLHVAVAEFVIIGVLAWRSSQALRFINPCGMEWALWDKARSVKQAFHEEDGYHDSNPVAHNRGNAEALNQHIARSQQLRKASERAKKKFWSLHKLAVISHGHAGRKRVQDYYDIQKNVGPLLEP